jgi:hypothetical protein
LGSRQNLGVGRGVQQRLHICRAVGQQAVKIVQHNQLVPCKQARGDPLPHALCGKRKIQRVEQRRQDLVGVGKQGQVHIHARDARRLRPFRERAGKVRLANP